MRSWATYLGLAVVVPVLADHPRPAPVDIKEWTVPWENTRPRDPYVDAEGRVWFVGQVGNYVAYLMPSSGEFKRYELEPGTGPHNLIVDPKGQVWYAGNRNAHIGRLDPETGKITRYPMPDSAARDPHTLIFDRDGNIWFTVQNGSFVGRLDVGTGEVRLLATPTSRARPYGIEIDSKNRPWVVLFNTNKLATVDPATMQLSEIPLPRAETRPRRIAITSDDRIWYVDYTGGYLGRYDPATAKVDEWPTPAGKAALPYAMAADERDQIWFFESGPKPNRLIGFDPKSGEFFSVTEVLPSGAGTVRHTYYHRPTRTLWFGTDANTIGRAVLPQAVP